MILFGYGSHVFSTWPMRPFQILVPEYTKFCLEDSKLNLGGIISKFDVLELIVNNSNREMGSLSFIILNNSINECRMCRCLMLSIFSELNIGLVCSSW